MNCASCGDEFATNDPLSENAALVTRISELDGEIQQKYVCNKGCQQRVWTYADTAPSASARQKAITYSEKIAAVRRGDAPAEEISE